MTESRWGRRVATAAVMAAAALRCEMAPAQQQQGRDRRAETVPRIQMAILLDTSNSMDGLINQARTQLWRIVSEFTAAELSGKKPVLEVGLYEYGNSGLPPQEGFVRMVVPLTRDLDRVSEALFALTTNGGQEYCGKVVDSATRELAWSNSNRDVKCIFIAGNEPFTQGDMGYREACRAAVEKGITVSTIFCGPHEEGIQTKWQEGARLADGSYASIDQNRSVADISAPQDAELARLSAELSKTYLAYGEAERRKRFADRQAAQDAHAAKAAAGVAAARAGFKVSGFYQNAGWDLLDALQAGHVKLEKLPTEHLPQAMQKMDLKQRRDYVRKMARQRKDLQAKAKALAAARKKYLIEQRAAMAAEAPAAAFDAAVIRAAREQAVEKHFEFKER